MFNYTFEIRPNYRSTKNWLFPHPDYWPPTTPQIMLITKRSTSIHLLALPLLIYAFSIKCWLLHLPPTVTLLRIILQVIIFVKKSLFLLKLIMTQTFKIPNEKCHTSARFLCSERRFSVHHSCIESHVTYLSIIILCFKFTKSSDNSPYGLVRDMHI